MTRDAGHRLARSLSNYSHRRDVVVLATTPASFSIAEGVAEVLHAPFDIFLVHEIAGGAVARGAYVPAAKALESAGLSLTAFVEAASAEEQRIAMLEAALRNGRPATRLSGATIILVDDGTTSEQHVLIAMTAIRRHGVNGIIVVSPLEPTPVQETQ